MAKRDYGDQWSFARRWVQRVPIAFLFVLWVQATREARRRTKDCLVKCSPQDPPKSDSLSPPPTHRKTYTRQRRRYISRDRTYRGRTRRRYRSRENSRRRNRPRGEKASGEGAETAAKATQHHIQSNQKKPNKTIFELVGPSFGLPRDQKGPQGADERGEEGEKGAKIGGKGERNEAEERAKGRKITEVVEDLGVVRSVYEIVDEDYNRAAYEKIERRRRYQEMRRKQNMLMTPEASIDVSEMMKRAQPNELVGGKEKKKDWQGVTDLSRRDSMASTFLNADQESENIPPKLRELLMEEQRDSPWICLWRNYRARKDETVLDIMRAHALHDPEDRIIMKEENKDPDQVSEDEGGLG
ncbi:hypothetical protein AAMO2058_001012100 [Amorphochlora amoebiformis]